MSAAAFLTADELLEILIAELPAGVYAPDFADDPNPAKRSVSTSELRAQAEMMAAASSNLELIYADKFLQTATADGLTRWESDLFSSAQDASVALDVRRQGAISKLRATNGISLPAIRSIVESILDLPFDLLPYSGQAGIGAWILEGSRLGVGTWLAELDPIMGARVENDLSPLDCAFDFEAEGLTAEQLASIQRTAYTFEIRIYGTADAATLKLLESRLAQYEPARSSHVIRNNMTPPSFDFSAYVAETPEFERFRI